MNIDDEIKFLKDKNSELQRELEKVNSDINKKEDELKRINEYGTNDVFEKILNVVKKITLFPINGVLAVFREFNPTTFEAYHNLIYYIIYGLLFILWLSSGMFLGVILIVWAFSISFIDLVIFTAGFISLGVLAEGVSRVRKGILALSRRKYTNNLRIMLDNDKDKMREIKEKIKKIIKELHMKEKQKRDIDSNEMWLALEKKDEERGEELANDTLRAVDDLIERLSNREESDDPFKLETFSFEIRQLIDKFSLVEKIEYQNELDAIMKEHHTLLEKSNKNDRLYVDSVIYGKLFKLKYSIERKLESEVLLNNNYNDIEMVVKSISLEDSFSDNLNKINMIVRSIADRRNELSLLQKGKLDSYIASIYIDIIKKSFVNGDFNEELLKEVDIQYIIAIVSVIDSESDKVMGSDDYSLQQQILMKQKDKNCDVYGYISDILRLLNNNKKGRVKRLNMGN